MHYLWKFVRHAASTVVGVAVGGALTAAHDAILGGGLDQHTLTKAAIGGAAGAVIGVLQEALAKIKTSVTK